MVKYVGYFFSGLGVLVGFLWLLGAVTGGFYYVGTGGHTGWPVWLNILIAMPWGLGVIVLITMCGKELFGNHE